MDITIQTSRRIKELVANGVITIGAHITREGNDIWARVVQPHPRLGIMTHTSYTLEEIEAKLEKYSLPSFTSKVTPTHCPNNVKAADELYGFKDSSDAASFARKNLREVKKGSIRNKLPLDSLVPTDFDMNGRDLFARTCLISEHITTSKIVARITTQRDRLTVARSSNLEEWWRNATYLQKIILLTRSKHLPKQADGQVRIHGYWLDKFESLPCPFRDAETQMGQEEEGFSAEEGDSSDEDLPSSTAGVVLQGW